MANVHIPIHFGFWEVILLAVVSTQGTAIAYLHQPRWKVLVLSLPLPFTLASMSLGRPIDVTHVTGLIVLQGFAHGTRLLHYNARVPIVAAIALSALAYCAAGAALAPLLPKTSAAFWVAAAGALAVAVVLYLALPYRREPGHRSLLPLWIKLPIIAAVICLLIAAKQLLSGFMAVFPMLAVVTTYEARHSLWTVCRQLAAIMLALVPMMVTVRLAQGLLGLGGALLAGWCVFLALFAPLAWKMWFAPARGAPGSGAGGTGAPPARVKERNRPCRLWRG